MRLRTLALGSAVALALSACTPAPTVDPAAEEQAIRSAVTRWNELLVAKNDSGLMAIYTDDAVLMPPNAPAVTGTAAGRAYFAHMWPMSASLVATTGAVEVMPSGDAAIEGGTWTFEMPTPAGPQRDNGKYLAVWKKVGGEWKISRDIWNSDNMPPAPAPADSTTKR